MAPTSVGSTLATECTTAQTSCSQAHPATSRAASAKHHLVRVPLNARTELTLDSDQVSVDACQPVDCVSDSSPTLDGGTAGCACNLGFSGTISWDTVTSAWVGVWKQLPVLRIRLRWTQAVCNPGYSGVIGWAQSVQAWTGSCNPDPCTSNSMKAIHLGTQASHRDPYR